MARLTPVALLLVCVWAVAQVQEVPQYYPTYGTREIDKLPRSNYAEGLWSDGGWYRYAQVAESPRFAIHLKPSFRVGDGGLERLCVIEAGAPGHRARASVRYDVVGWNWYQDIDWLAPKVQYRPCWLPVTTGATRATLLRDGASLGSCTVSTAEGAPWGLFEVAVRGEPPHVDHGYALLPASWVVAEQGQSVCVAFAARDGLAAAALIEADLRGSQGEPVPLPGAVTERGGSLDTAGLPPGQYALSLRAELAGADTVRSDWRVVVVEERRPPGFGAHYTDLRYMDPVYVSRTETKPWDALWEGSSLQDLVVTFPGTDARYVFWRGTSYVPCWAFNNGWLTYEWLEAEPDYYGAVDCVEPIMDKGCKYSRARIVSATDARVVVQWSYALTDFEQKIIRDERADETYTFYPDGVGVRKLVAWIKSGWHENQEYISLNRPGNPPHIALEPQAVTFLTTDGRSERPIWPSPFLDVEDWPHIISRVNMPGAPSPFMVADCPAEVKVWASPHVDKPGLFNTYIHWPVSRGVRTAWLDDPADWKRPTHSNLVNIVHSAAERGEGCQIWRWLIGVSERERDLKQFTASWLEPGRVTVSSGTFEGYDKGQRAYVIAAEPAARSLRVSVSPSGEAIRNPAFVIRGAGPWLLSAACEGARQIKLGRENGGADLVVWIEGRFESSLTLIVD